MKAENKHTIMVWAIVVLAIMNISTFVTIMYHQHQAETIIPNDVKKSKLEAVAEKYSGRYFKEQLGFNSEQMDKFREFNRPFRMQAREITLQLADVRKSFLQEIAAPNSDTAKLNALSDSIGEMHKKLKKLMFQYCLDIKAICNDEQKEKLNQLFQDIFINESPMALPGHGPMKGMKKGMGQGQCKSQ